jgi:AraC-like DNA-binding protein
MYQLDSRKYWSDPKVPVQFEFRDPQAPFPRHVHDFHELAFMYSGTATHITVNGDYTIESGDCISVKPGQAHGYKNIRNLVLMNVLIKSAFFTEDHFGMRSLPAWDALFGQEYDAAIERSPITRFRLDFGSFQKAKSLIETASAELTDRREGYRAIVTGLLLELVVLLVRCYGDRQNAAAGFASDLTALFSYVHEHFRSVLSMDALTGVSGMSPSHVHRVFKRHLGCSPFQYISRLRLSEAADALIQTDKPITQIALDLGFNDSNYFTRLFRKQTGLSPREYRGRYVTENLL